jgi:hypothetical protein
MKYPGLKQHQFLEFRVQHTHTHTQREPLNLPTNKNISIYIFQIENYFMGQHINDEYLTT